jgi:MinD-like ATPase involved in chromosome partitioning or flagellar assembly
MEKAHNPVGRSYLIRVSSEKGGVGKTIVSVNLAIALSKLKYKTLLIDFDLPDPNVDLNFDISKITCGYFEVLLGKCALKESLRRYSTYLDIIPSSPVELNQKIQSQRLEEIANKTLDLGYDFIIVDTAPGLLYLYLIRYINEALIVSTSEMSSVISSARLSKQLGERGITSNFVINKYAKNEYVVDISDVESLLGRRVLATLPETNAVPLSISKRNPALLMNKNKLFSKGIYELARHFISQRKLFNTTNKSRYAIR